MKIKTACISHRPKVFSNNIWAFFRLGRELDELFEFKVFRYSSSVVDDILSYNPVLILIDEFYHDGWTYVFDDNPDHPSHDYDPTRDYNYIEDIQNTDSFWKLEGNTKYYDLQQKLILKHCLKKKDYEGAENYLNVIDNYTAHNYTLDDLINNRSLIDSYRIILISSGTKKT